MKKMTEERARKLLEGWIKENEYSNHLAGLLLGGYHRSMVGRWRKGATSVPKAVVVLLRIWN
jgi:hypothetical protein